MKTDTTIRRVDWEKFSLMIIVMTCVLAYANSFSGVFLYDDIIRIDAYTQIRHAWHSMLNSTRPLVGLSIYFNYLYGGLNPTSYHAVNLVIHCIAGLLLFGIVRCTLRLPGLVERYGRSSSGLALTVATVWVVHPLQTESVTYIIQRAESLMGLFYLLTLYCVLRGVQSQSPHRWYTAAIAACALGMATKPVMVTAPVMVLLYDRFFISTSAANALRTRWSLYVGLAATWLILVALLSVPNESSASAGFNAGIASPVAYLLTQPGVVLHYLKLAVWPRSLCLDYAWSPASTPAEILMPSVFVLALIFVSLFASVHRHPFGFAGLWFFIILAPSSSIVPVADYAAEHRMYLPLAGVIVLLVMVVHNLFTVIFNNAANYHVNLNRVSIAVSVMAVAILLLATIQRNRVYSSAETMWRDVIAKRPHNLRAQLGIGAFLLGRGEHDGAEAYFKKILTHVPEISESTPAHHLTVYAMTHNNLGVIRYREGKYSAAATHFREAIRVVPQLKDARKNLKNAIQKLSSEIGSQVP